MSKLPKTIQDLIDEFAKLPGIGPKSAARLVFYLLAKPNRTTEELSQTVSDLKKNLKTCKVCFNYSESDPCDICSDERRRRDKICVVEEPLDVIALEKAGFDGLYHVIGGIISPINGIGPEHLRIGQLIDRIKEADSAQIEIILAMNPSIEGEATAAYIGERLENCDVKITQLARGLPVGGDLEYADEITLSKSLEGRKGF